MYISELSGAWAISREKFNEIRALCEKKEDAARNAFDSFKRGQDFDVVNGVAVLPLTGVLTRGFDLFTVFLGGTSTEMFQRDFLSAVNNPDIKAIILDVDYPGGMVNGTSELANVVFGSRGKKPIIALANGNALSAAYWIASAADKVFISGGTSQVGSIGVVATHVDISEAERMRGIKTTEIASGKFKRIDTQHLPLSEEGKQTIQETVDALFAAFIGEVSSFRNISTKLSEEVTGGKVFVGLQGMRAGLADGVSSLDALINSLGNGETFRVSNNNRAQGANIERGINTMSNMTLEQRAELKWKNDPAIRVEFRSFEIFHAYVKGVDSGQIKRKDEELQELFAN